MFVVYMKVVGCMYMYVGRFLSDGDIDNISFKIIIIDAKFTVLIIKDV